MFEQQDLTQNGMTLPWELEETGQVHSFDLRRCWVCAGELAKDLGLLQLSSWSSVRDLRDGEVSNFLFHLVSEVEKKEKEIFLIWKGSGANGV